jgi:CheY-like chemotaxis protein
MARVLIIDDEPEIRTLVQAVLDGAGYQTIQASDGREGIAIQRKNPSDLIITDLIMPGQEGLETIIELRRLYPKVRIVAMSGGGHGGVLDFLPMASQLGAARTLAKPFTRDQLLTAVREALAS